jgi:glycine/D-amino acid oxidase-like deaminating enzyme
VAKAIVIGAGVIGCSIAFEMAAKVYEVVSIDKAQGPGQGSTGASSAVVRLFRPNCLMEEFYQS